MKRTVLITLSAVFAIITSAYIWQLIGTPHQLLTNTLFLIPPGLAVISGIYAIHTYHLSSLRGKVTAYLTAGLACWFIGEVIFYLFQFVFHIDPFPSLADVFYIVAYPLMLTGLIKEIKVHSINWRSINRLALVLGGFLTLALAFIVVYFSIYKAYNASESLLSNIIAIGYGVGDLILLIPVFFILKVALDFRGGKLFNSWMLILVALLFIMVGDILFAIYTDQYKALIPQYSLIDLAWVIGYLLFTYSLFYTAATIKELQSTLVKN